MASGQDRYYEPLCPLPHGRSVRAYHVYTVVAFLTANLFNFVLNRRLTFRRVHRGSAPGQYLRFLTTGVLAQAIGLVILTVLMTPSSPGYLSWSFLSDDGHFWTKRYYWALGIQIALTMPINFLANKAWTFRAGITHVTGFNKEKRCIQE